MKSNKLEHSHKKQMLRAEVKPNKAELSAKSNNQELPFQREIWTEWAANFSQTEREIY